MIHWIFWVALLNSTNIYPTAEDFKIYAVQEHRAALPNTGSNTLHIFKNVKANKLASKIIVMPKVAEVYDKLEKELGGEVATRFLLVIATESGGNWRSVNKNKNGSYDCGLLQINQRGACTEKSFNTSYQMMQTIAKYKYRKFKPWYGAWYHGNLLRLVGVRQVWNVR